MMESSREQPPEFQFSKVFWIGIVVLAVGTGPLFITMLLASLGLTKDPNPNPVGFGIMAFFTFYPSIALIVVGLIISMSRSRSVRKRVNNQPA
jgi:hypothetical protein